MQRSTVPYAEDPIDIKVFLLGFYLAALSSISTQFLIIYLHLPIPLIGLAQLGVTFAFLTSGKFFAFLNSKLSKFWLGLGLWWALACVLSVYPGGSIPEMMTYYTRLYPIPFLFGAIVTSARQVRWLMHAFAWGYVLVIIFCFMFGSYSNDARYNVSEIPALGNPNDLALHLMFGASFLLVFSGSKLRLLLLGILPAVLMLVLRTGSRANMLAIFLISLICLKLLPSHQRVRILGGMVLGGLLLSPFLPKATVARLGTFFGVAPADASSEDLQSAEASTEARKELQKQGLIITLKHPIFGVGPEMFRLASDLVVRENTGHRSGWQGTHNTYLQVSSETGLPGLFFFAGSLFTCIGMNYRCLRAAQTQPALREYRITSFPLLIACCVYAFDVLFSHIGYDYHVPVLVGFTAANYGAFQQILRNTQNQAPVQQPVPKRNGFIRPGPKFGVKRPLSETRPA